VLSHVMALACIGVHSRVSFASCVLCCGHRQELLARFWAADCLTEWARVTGAAPHLACRGASTLVLSHVMALACIDVHSRMSFASCVLCCGHRQEHVLLAPRHRLGRF
jgi:hypothetical protein